MLHPFQVMLGFELRKKVSYNNDFTCNKTWFLLWFDCKSIRNWSRFSKNVQISVRSSGGLLDLLPFNLKPICSQNIKSILILALFQKPFISVLINNNWKLFSKSKSLCFNWNEVNLQVRQGLATRRHQIFHLRCYIQQAFQKLSS